MAKRLAGARSWALPVSARNKGSKNSTTKTTTTNGTSFMTYGWNRVAAAASRWQPLVAGQAPQEPPAALGLLLAPQELLALETQARQAPRILRTAQGSRRPQGLQPRRHLLYPTKMQKASSCDEAFKFFGKIPGLHVEGRSAAACALYVWIFKFKARGFQGFHKIHDTAIQIHGRGRIHVNF